MARLILDTTVLVEAERSGADLASALDEADDLAIAAITAAELLVGPLLSSGTRATRRQAFVDEVLATIPIELYDLRVARAHAALLAHCRTSGRPRGAHDLLVAATARSTGRTVVSADVSAFDDLPGVDLRPVLPIDGPGGG